jgi:hypothetical protein
MLVLNMLRAMVAIACPKKLHRISRLGYSQRRKTRLRQQGTSQKLEPSTAIDGFVFTLILRFKVEHPHVVI